MIRRCPKCGGQFEAKGDWQKLCWDCWRERKDREVEAHAYERGYRAGYLAGEQKGYTLGCRVGAEDGREYGRTHALDPGLLRQLVQLCHPDRHPPERQAIANGATATLIDLLERARGVAT